MTAHSRMAGAAQAARLPSIRTGIVTNVDPSTHTVRVRLDPDGQESGWMPDMAIAAAGLRIACPSEIGTQVVVAPLGADAEVPAVIGRMLSDVQVLPPVSPATNQTAQPGELLVMAGQGAPPAEDGGSVGAPTQGAGWFHVTASGVFLGAGNLKVAITSAGLAVTGGTITSDTDVVAAGISGANHVHGGIQRGGANTNGPMNA